MQSDVSVTGSFVDKQHIGFEKGGCLLSAKKLSLRASLNTREITNLVKPGLTAKKDTCPVHKLFSYPAKFQARLPTELIRSLTSAKSLVVDPFSGGGTTSAAAFLLGRKSYATDLNPISVLVSKAKTTRISTGDREGTLGEIRSLRPKLRASNLSKEETVLMGPSLSSFVESTWRYLDTSTRPTRFLVASILIKRIKLACRRDKIHLRTARFDAHIEYLIKEISTFLAGMEGKAQTQLISNVVELRSNHALPLNKNSADIIITSPPYPNIDVEYNLIQLQRRDLGRCFRSDVGERISQDILNSNSLITKKMLCLGGELSNYWINLERSLLEMSRILKPEAPCFLYIGFKCEIDKRRFERLTNDVGLRKRRIYKVSLGKERVASSRGLYHGRDTSMLKGDFLYYLEATSG